MKNSHQWVWNMFAFFALCGSGIMAYYGRDKMVNYYSSELYSSLNKNAYVGGDAYNYIINGTYATSYFVLALLFAVLAVGFIVAGYLDKLATLKENSIQVHDIVNETENEQIDEESKKVEISE